MDWQLFISRTRIAGLQDWIDLPDLNAEAQRKTAARTAARRTDRGTEMDWTDAFGKTGRRVRRER